MRRGAARVVSGRPRTADGRSSQCSAASGRTHRPRATSPAAGRPCCTARPRRALCARQQARLSGTRSACAARQNPATAALPTRRGNCSATQRPPAGRALPQLGGRERLGAIGAAHPHRRALGAASCRERGHAVASACVVQPRTQQRAAAHIRAARVRCAPSSFSGGASCAMAAAWRARLGSLFFLRTEHRATQSSRRPSLAFEATSARGVPAAVRWRSGAARHAERRAARRPVRSSAGQRGARAPGAAPPGAAPRRAARASPRKRCAHAARAAAMVDATGRPAVIIDNGTGYTKARSGAPLRAHAACHERTCAPTP
jgi:hypothetical protein